MSTAKRNSLLLLAVAGVTILLIAMGLPSVVLSPGQPFSLGPAQVEAASGERVLPAGEWILWIFQGLVALALILLPVYIAFSLLTRKGRERLMGDLMALALLLVAANLASQRRALTPQPGQATGMPTDWGQFLDSGPSTSFSATPPSWLTLFVLLLVSVLAGALILEAVWFLQRRRHSRNTSWEQLGQEAREALDALQTGGELQMTIIRCYQAMARVVNKERGIARGTAMTPREFEDYLVSKGLPREPIRTLTRLFERVRYGSLSVGRREEDLGFSCLTDIIAACQAIGIQNENH
jgi:hypothetical protein